MNPLTFSTPEFALLSHFHFPDLLPLDKSALKDLQIDPEERRLLQVRLEEEGWLIYAPGDETPDVPGDLARVLEALFFPDHVFILQVANFETGEEQSYIFSWANSLITCNFVTPKGKQVIHVLEGPEAVVETALRYGLPPDYQPQSPPQTPLPSSPEALAEHAWMAVRWIKAADPAAPDTGVEAGGWVVTPEALWLLTSQEQKPQITAVGLEALQAWLSQALPTAS